MSIRSAIASTSRIIPPLASSSRCFTTTPLVLAEQKKKSTVATVKKRQVAGFSGVKKKSGTQRSSGARVKSLKLSYAMASETPDLGDLKILENGNTVAQHVGAPTTFSKKTFVKLATMGLPRKLEKELDASGQPASIIRQLTVEMADKLADGDQKSSSENKYVLSGESGSGKSVLLLQTVSLAYAADWIVIYAPRAFEWTDGTSPYRYNPSTQMFDQPAIAESMLQGFSSVNGAVLSKIKTEEGTDLARICKNALSGGDTIKALETCLDTIAKQTEYPVLFAVDDVQALYAATKYKNPQFETLQSYNFSVPRLALNFLSGRKNLARGMVVSAYSHTTPNVPLSPEFSYALELDSTRPITPYTKMDPAHLAHATAPATKIEVPFGLSTQEAAGMFELWSRRGWTLKSSDEMFMGAFTAAMGNPREFGRGLRFTRQATEHY